LTLAAARGAIQPASWAAKSDPQLGGDKLVGRLMGADGLNFVAAKLTRRDEAAAG